MTKYVREMKAARPLSAYIVLHGARYVATVQTYYGGRAVVNVFQSGDAWRACGAAFGMDMSTRVGEKAAHGRFQFQYGSAGGGGYDKITAALSDMWIDGHRLTGHCEMSKEKPEIGYWLHTETAPPGWEFANTFEPVPGVWAYRDCYRKSGFDYLRALGYTIHQAI